MRRRIEEFCFAESLGPVVWVAIVPLLLLDRIAGHSAGRDGFKACGGDGGEPWAARPSPLGKFCDHLNNGGLDTWLVYPIPLLVAVVGLVLIYVPRRGWRPTAVKVTTMVIGFVLMVGSFVPPATVIYLNHSFSRDCQGTLHYDRTSPEAQSIIDKRNADCSNVGYTGYVR